MSIETAAAVIHEPQGKFVIETVVLDDLRDDEVLVRNEASGICHTDFVGINLLTLPAVVGHEGVGIVEAVGSAVSYVKPNDRVIMSYPSCGCCLQCKTDQPYHCDQHIPLGFNGVRMDGSSTMSLNGAPLSGAFFQQSSFANHSIASEHNLIKIGSSYPSELLASIPCGVQTGAGSVLNTFKVKKNQSIVIFGAGAVGLSAVMAAKLVGASPIIAVDIISERLNLALEFGATHIINATSADVAEQVKDILPHGAKYTLETSANEQALEDAITSVKTGGECGMVIAPHFGEKYPFSPTEIFKRAANLKGIIQGSSIPRKFLIELLELNKKGLMPFDKMTKTYDFTDINKAVHDTKSGKTIKSVLKIS